MQGNAWECQGNVREWVQSVRGMLGNAGNARGMYGSGCKVAGNVGQIRGMRELMGVGAKCQGEAGECMGVGAKCQKNAG